MKQNRRVDGIYKLLTGMIAIFIIIGISGTSVILEQHRIIEKYEMFIEDYIDDYELLYDKAELLEEALIDANTKLERLGQ